MTSELLIAIIAQSIVIIFSAGLLWMKTSDIADRVKRIESWINGTNNSEGLKLTHRK